MVLNKKPKVYNISVQHSFLHVLASGILDRVGHNQEMLSSVKVLLPTRAACRILKEIFVDISGRKSTLLPSIISLGDIDLDEVDPGEMFDLESEFEFDKGHHIPPPISPIRRQLLLAKLVIAQSRLDMDQAVQLAAELAHLLDQIHTARLSLRDLNDLVPGEYTMHWQEILEFLKILIDNWPRVLEAEGMLDPSQRRNQVLESKMRVWKANPPDYPVFAAGSTGSIPATADLLSVISRLPKGALILPGLDLKAPDVDWKRLDVHHPQYGLAHLLNHIGARRRDVKNWHNSNQTELSSSKEGLLDFSFRSPSTNEIQDLNAKNISNMLDNFKRIDCATPREEAGVVALAIRHALETPKKTVALVTPDRALARRVISELERWNIEVDDSAGQPLSSTKIGSFILLISQMVSGNFSPISTLAVFKHSLASGGMERRTFLHLTQELERFVLRGPRPEGGLDSLRVLIEKDTRTKDILHPLINSLEKIFSPLIKEISKSNAIFSDILKAHLIAAENFAATDEKSGSERLWAGEFSKDIATFFSTLLQDSNMLNNFEASYYSIVLDSLMRGKTLRADFSLRKRVKIWGLMEARLQRADMTVLSGLNESCWPPEIKSSPWMSRPMMVKFGLSLPERRIGLTAHDFFQGCAAKEVLLTRSKTIKGTPSITSRWLTRLENVLSVLGIGHLFSGNNKYLNWYSEFDTPNKVKPISPPAPKPPVNSRPRSLPVTRIETLIRDPYSVYAEKILELKPLEPLDADPSLAERGLIIHKALEIFIKEMPKEATSQKAYEELVSIGKGIFENSNSHPGVKVYWWPRFLRIARWFVDFEINRRQSGIKNLGTEKVGKLEILQDHNPFTLTARVDRIDRLPNGSLAIIDYKTGVPPSSKQVGSGLAPQLPLEALILFSGGIQGIGKQKIGEIAYVRLSGGRLPGEIRTLGLNINDVMNSALKGLCQMILQFDLVDTPYLSRPRPQFKSRFNLYDHLARVKEWGSGGFGDDIE